ncbi:MAG: hypothetical protein F6K39_15540 [Okeania sp. SIO3B3]|nr:hypothetical protein [Okeania sp. SIO3B3]
MILACQKYLIRLLETIPGIEQCVDSEANFHNFYVHLPLLELPRILGSTLDNISLPIPNLKIPNTQAIKLELLGKHSAVSYQLLALLPLVNN